MNYKFKIHDKKYDVSIPNEATFHAPTKVHIDKSELELLIHEFNENEIKSFFVNNKFYKIKIEKDQDGYPTGIFANDQYYPVALLKIDKLLYYKEKYLKTNKPGILKSFIPGNIKKIFFSVNDRVKENDIILIHEAMKMENEIQAPKSGIIKSINVTEGENILANHLLFEIE